MDFNLILALVFLIWLSSAEINQGPSPSYINLQLPIELYTDTWVVQLVGEQHHEEADLLATKHGFVNLGQVGNLDGYYDFRLIKYPNKRNIHPTIGSKREDITQTLQNELNVGFVAQQKRRQRFKKDYDYPIDPDFSKQWSLVNTGQTNGRKGLDLNVEPVWLQGITGNGVVVSIMDDGLEVRHPDLSPNYDSSASWDFVEDDNDPTPSNYYGKHPDNHGTRCAGEISMAKNNNVCGVGVSYDSNIGCLRFNLSDDTDVVEARSLGYKNSYIQVYSNSWGPSDIGFVVDGPGPLLLQTLKDGINKGRDNKGSIYVWAAGNGGWNDDSCAVDGYSSSIYTISVGSADQKGAQAGYDENCAGKMAVTYSFDSQSYSQNNDFDPYNQISTTTLDGKCTDGFTGTSASAPLVSGIIALALQANSLLTWRDVQYLLAYTSNPSKLSKEGWAVNGGGLMVSHKFGFGAIDAEAMVTRARHWITVPPQMKSTVPGHSIEADRNNFALPGQPLVLQFTVAQDIQFCEHVVLTASLIILNKGRAYGVEDYNYFVRYMATSEDSVRQWLQDPHPRRGDIKLELTSPNGTTSTILPYRKYDFINTDKDTNNEAFYNWPFMSVHYWGENPNGEWNLTVSYKSLTGYVDVYGVELTVYGTANTPQAVLDSSIQCSESCDRGCYGPSSRECDTCKDLRIVSTLECVSDCPTDTFYYKGSYCTDYLITLPSQQNVTLTVSLSVGFLAGFICILCIVAIICGLKYACKRKKVEHHRYRILHSEDMYSNTLVTV